MTPKDLEKARASIMKPSQQLDGIAIKGYEFNNGFEIKRFLESFYTTGFQATNLAKAISITQKMRDEREQTEGFTLFLGYTSNQVTSGNRESIRYLVEHKLIDVIVTTAGGVEEDIIKCLKPFILGDFRAPGGKLREAGINRTGNIFVPNDRYILFEQFLTPILNELTSAGPRNISPSELCRILGEKINNTESILYWAAKNNIPVYCPAITDGSLGDIAFFHQINEINKGNQQLHIDSLADTAALNKRAIESTKTGILIVGAGIVKHAILNANMMREGADYAVYINTSAEFDGSDSGAEPEEAKSWGKVASDANTVKVVCDATIALPLLVAGTYL
jgi:deoxyhypusine synthase